MCRIVEQLPQALLEIRPTIFVGVPRVYEKIHSQVEVKAIGFPKRSIYRWALSVGRKHQAETLAGRTPASLSWKIADRIVYSKVRAGMGGHAQIYISGGAPLGRRPRRMVCQHRHTHSRRLRPDGNLSRHRRQYAEGSQARQRGTAAV